MPLLEWMLATSLLVPFKVEGDAIPAPLEGRAGDAARGRAIVAQRSQGLCLLCHAAPIPEERQQGNLAPDLAGVGRRLSEGQLRLRLVAPQAVNAQSIMPAYYRAGPDSGLQRVAREFDNKPVLDAQQIEDIVAYLRTLK
ncbi:sulfur oxidation c-type cytochrome SoxX [Roseateles depolymerans]|uniref:Cytochrome C n=1 Tax=Roseateles depolymerans TaxID=76731 RepID=A0A0U3NLG7_9BURK|nr:sulfur oxidation c-type cytochrome SoxX [Roseateles depolymerans]ALV09216.1 Cytochrome C [Roseateles depolymerans]REG13973.1 sulfur-oxidizing protein SoxX [Roseateles depolymerans]